MFTIYRVQTSNLDAPRVTVAGEVGSERLAQALCKYLAEQVKDNGQTAYIWTQFSWRMSERVDQIIKRILSCKTLSDLSVEVNNGIELYGGSEAEKTAMISSLVFRLKMMGSNKRIDAALSMIFGAVDMERWRGVLTPGQFKIEQAVIPPAV